MSQYNRSLSPFFFLSDAATLSHINHVRHWAGTVAHLPFGSDVIVDTCVGIERSGMSSGHLLSATAEEYVAFQDIEQLIATLAGRIGNPRISPKPPHWPLLALLLLGWRNTTSVDRVIKRSRGLGVEDEAHRGLAIIVHLFPELTEWVAGAHLRLPLWERAFAVPLAARKLVLTVRMD